MSYLFGFHCDTHHIKFKNNCQPHIIGTFTSGISRLPSQTTLSQSPMFIVRSQLPFKVTWGWTTAGDMAMILLWVPLNDKTCHWSFLCTVTVVPKAQSTTLNLSKFIHGMSWIECYTSTTKETSPPGDVGLSSLCFLTKFISHHHLYLRSSNPHLNTL